MSIHCRKWIGNSIRLLASLTVLLLLVICITAKAVYAASYAEGILPQITKMVNHIESTFPPINGYVIGVEGNTILLDMGVKSKAEKGMELYVFREGKVFYHPVTGVKLGTLEEALGAIRVTEIKPQYSVGEIVSLEEGKEIRTGDRVRISSMRMRLIVPPLINKSKTAFDTDSFTNALIMGIKQSGRFEVVPDGKLLEALDEFKLSVEHLKKKKEKIREVCAFLKSKAIVFTELKKLKTGFIVDSSITSGTTGNTISETSVAIKEWKKKQGFPAMYSPLMGGGDTGFIVRGLGGGFGDTGLTLGQAFKFEIRGIGYGDVNADGIPEIVVSDGKNVHIYKWNGEVFEKLWSEERASNSNHIAIDVADINGNGTPEIFVTDYVSPSLCSYILEWREGKFVHIGGTYTIYMRVLERFYEDGKPALIGQHMGIKNGFSGKIYVYKWQNDEYERDVPLVLPDDVNVYGFTIGDIKNDGSNEIVCVDDHDRVKLYNGNLEREWKSDEHYGGYDTTIEIVVRGSLFDTIKDIELTGDGSGGALRKIRIKGRLLLRDSEEEEGLKEVVIVQNVPETTYILEETRMYRSGYLVGLAWNGMGMEERWRTRKISSYIDDFCFGDINGDGTEELIIATTKKKFLGEVLGTEKSRIIFYEME